MLAEKGKQKFTSILHTIGLASCKDPKCCQTIFIHQKESKAILKLLFLWLCK